MDDVSYKELSNEFRAQGIEIVIKLWEADRHNIAEEDLTQFDFSMSFLKLLATKVRNGVYDEK